MERRDLSDFKESELRQVSVGYNEDGYPESKQRYQYNVTCQEGFCSSLPEPEQGRKSRLFGVIQSREFHLLRQSTTRF